MIRWILLLMVNIAVPSFGLDLSQYPYPSEPKPMDFSTLPKADKERAQKVPTDYVGFLFVSSCDPAERSSEFCLWAYVHTLFPSKIALEQEAGSSAITLYSLPLDGKARYDLKAVRQFVAVLALGSRRDIPAGTVVNGKSVEVAFWVKRLDKEGKPVGIVAPMIWLPVTDANQTLINSQYYQGLRTNPRREVRFEHSDLQAGQTAPGSAFFVVIGFDMADPAQENHYFVARRHPAEVGVFTSTLRRARVIDGEAQVFDWRGYTFTSVKDRPTSFESLGLDGGNPPVLRARITPKD